MKRLEKEYFEDEERSIWNIRCQKQRLLIKSDNENELVDLYNNAEFHLHSLQQMDYLKRAYEEREQLLKRIYGWRDKCHKAHSKRLWLTYIGFFAAYQFILFSAAKVIGPDTTEFIEEITIFAAMIIPSLVIAGIHFLINFSIFDYLFKKDREEYNHWNYLKNEIGTVEDKIAGDQCPTEQEFNQIKQRYEEAKQKLEKFPTN